MLISEKHNYLYIHVYKVAGQSVKLALRSQEHPRLPALVGTPLAKLVESPMAYTFRPLGPHASAREIRDWLGEDAYGSLFKFAFVRNPWDWQVSLYHFIQQNKLNHQRRLVSSMSFDEYIDWRVTEDRHLQSEYLCDRHGEVLVDFVGRYERLPEDFATVTSRLGLQASLPHVNATDHRDYRSYYTDLTRALVADAFAEDIERFGYTFG
jgi:hypothetical protein